MIVRELELDLDAFEGPFDLLLTLVLKDELTPSEVDVAEIVVAFCERLAEHATRPVSPQELPLPDDTGAAIATPQSAEHHQPLDLEACGEFLVLVAALLELKVRGLFPEDDDEADLGPDEAAEELAVRLAEYRRIKEAALRLAERLEAERDRYFRLGPSPLQPRPERLVARHDPALLTQALRALAAEPPKLSLAHMELRFPPVSQFLARFRAVLRRRQRFDFDTEVAGLSRVEQAVAFLALLELARTGEVSLAQGRPFAPIRVSRARVEGRSAWIARSA